jgi:multidrug efflux pump subunit AcrB
MIKGVDHMKQIIQALSKRLLLSCVIILLLFVWGFYSASQMKKEYLPEINNPILMVTVQTSMDSNGESKASQINKTFTSVLKNVDHLQSIESTIYSQGLFLSLTFPQNVDIRQAEESVRASLQTIPLPAGVSRPEVTRISSDSFPFMKISLASKTKADAGLLTANIDQIQKQLEQLPGIEKIQALGNGQIGYVVTLNNKKLDDYGLGFEDIKEALQHENISWPEGIVQTKNFHLPLSVESPSIDKNMLENTIVGKEKNKPVLLKDVATIEKGIVHLQTLSRTNGNPSVILNLFKTPSSDVTKVSQEVTERLDHLHEVKSGEIQTKILLNQGLTVKHAIEGIWREGALGCIFSTLFVFLFFRQWRSTIAIIFSLPICFLATIAVLNTMGITLNLLTASGLIVSMGRVVDDSIVILDNMYRKLERQGRFSLTSLSDGVKEMIPAVISSTLTTIAVFLPLAVTDTMVGHVFAGFAWAVTIALLSSLAVSLFLIPPYAAYTWGRRFVPQAPPTEQWAKPVLERLLKKRTIWFACLCGALFLSGVGAFFIPVDVFPRSHAQDINIQIECPEGSTLGQMNAEVREFESLLSKHSEIKTFSSTMGSSFTPMFDDVFDQEGGWIQQANVANVYVTPKEGVNVERLTNKINNDIKQLSTNAVYTVSNQQIAGDDSRVRIVLSGATPNVLSKTANLLKSKLQMIKGLQIYGEAEQGDSSRFAVQLNEEKMNSLGVDKKAVLHRIDSFMDRNEEISVTRNGSAVPIDLHKPSDVSLSYKQGLDSTQEFLLKLGNLSFNAKNGKTVSLADIATLKVKPNSVISEKDGVPIAVVSGNIITPDIDDVTEQIKQTIQDSNLPKGIHIDFGGIPQQMEQMIWSISFAGILSILLVLIIITSVFKGIRAPLAVLSSLPFALIGSVAFLLLFKQSWNLGALAGLVMLIGIVSTNGIVLVDRMERLREQGQDLHTVIIDGTASRVRPILMTTATTVLTLLPLSFSHQSETLISQSLGLVVAGGMITATLTSLLVIPTIYDWLSMRKNR